VEVVAVIVEEMVHQEEVEVVPQTVKMELKQQGQVQQDKVIMEEVLLHLVESEDRQEVVVVQVQLEELLLQVQQVEMAV
jgi:hypothetical protein